MNILFDALIPKDFHRCTQLGSYTPLIIFLSLESLLYYAIIPCYKLPSLLPYNITRMLPLCSIYDTRNFLSLLILQVTIAITGMLSKTENGFQSGYR